MERNINWIKTNKLGINGPISWTHRTQNSSKNQNLYPQQSQITLFTLPWDTLYNKWDFKPQTSSIFSFEYVNEVWISGVLGVKIFHQKKFMKIDEMVDVFLNSANFWQNAFSTLAPPSSYSMNLKTLTKVSKVTWASHLSYEILYSSFLKKNFSHKTHRLGLRP